MAQSSALQHCCAWQPLCRQRLVPVLKKACDCATQTLPPLSAPHRSSTSSSPAAPPPHTLQENVTEELSRQVALKMA